MRNECDIVEDLLFSYNDGVLSNSSKELVDEHLKKCEKCKKKLEEIIQENNEHNQKNQIKEIDFFKRIKKKITKRNVIILVFFIILMLVVLFNIHVYNNYKEIASTMEIYLKDDITEQQIENIKNKIKTNIKTFKNMFLKSIIYPPLFGKITLENENLIKAELTRINNNLSSKVDELEKYLELYPLK